MEVIVYGDANALLTMTHAEGAAQLNLVAQVVVRNQLLKLAHHLAGTLDMAGTVIEENPVTVTEEDVRTAVSSFIGEIIISLTRRRACGMP